MRKIYSIARGLFLDRGIERTSLNAVATAIGVGITDFKRRYGLKDLDALAREVLTRFPKDELVQARGMQAGLRLTDREIADRYPFLADPFYSGMSGHLMEATTRLVGKFGFDAVTRPMIAREAGVSIGFILTYGGQLDDIKRSIATHCVGKPHLSDIEAHAKRAGLI
jgi:AcrR family transcriptional regulator